MGRHQLLVELMLPDRGRRVLLEMRGRNVVVLKVVLGGMRLTGGHHPKREAGASLTSPTAPAPTLSRLPLLLFLLQHFPLSTLFVRFLSVLISSPPFTDVLLATPTQPQVVPGFISRELPVSLQPAVALSKHCIRRSTDTYILSLSPFSFSFPLFLSFRFLPPFPSPSKQNNRPEHFSLSFHVFARSLITKPDR